MDALSGWYKRKTETENGGLREETFVRCGRGVENESEGWWKRQ